MSHYDGQIADTADDVLNYVNPQHPKYDPEFATAVAELGPDWTKAQDKKWMLEQAAEKKAAVETVVEKLGAKRRLMRLNRRQGE